MTCIRVLPILALTLGLAAAPASAAQERATLTQGQQPADTQTVEPSLIHWSLGLAMGVPIGEFRDNVDFSVGMNAALDFGLARGLVRIGAEGTGLWYGSQSRNVPLVGLPDLAVGIDTSNEMFLLHGRVRVQQPTGRVRPYADGLVGFNYIATTTSVDAEETCYWFAGTYSCSSDGDSTTNLDDVVLSAGGGAGVQVAFGKEPHALWLDLSLRYLYGGEALYLTEDDLRWEPDGSLTLRPRRSRTDMLLVTVGLTFGR